MLALERIEQDEELSFEVVSYRVWVFLFNWLSVVVKLLFLILQQILVLETNLFLNGLNFYDQHRDMRLDIDNMSYEVCYCCHITTFR